MEVGGHDSASGDRLETIGDGIHKKVQARDGKLEVIRNSMVFEASALEEVMKGGREEEMRTDPRTEPWSRERAAGEGGGHL